VTNAATDEKIKLQMPTEVIASENQRQIMKSLAENGVKLAASKDIKIYVMAR